MFDRQQLEELRQALDNWEETTRQQAAARMGDRRSQFITTSSSPVHELYTPLDIAGLDGAPESRDSRSSWRRTTSGGRRCG